MPCAHLAVASAVDAGSVDFDFRRLVGVTVIHRAACASVANSAASSNTQVVESGEGGGAWRQGGKAWFHGLCGRLDASGMQAIIGAGRGRASFRDKIRALRDCALI